MVSEIVVENGTKIITLKTIIDIKNHYTKPVNVFRFDGKNGWPKVGRIEPNQTFNVPLQAVYSEPYEFSFQICGQCKFKCFLNFWQWFDDSIKVQFFWPIVHLQFDNTK